MIMVMMIAMMTMMLLRYSDFDFMVLETREKLSDAHAQSLKEQRIRQLESINNQ
jgi:hypothetical protein